MYFLKFCSLDIESNALSCRWLDSLTGLLKPALFFFLQVGGKELIHLKVILVEPVNFFGSQQLFEDALRTDGAEGQRFKPQISAKHAFTSGYRQNQVLYADAVAASLIHARLVGSNHAGM